MPYPKKVEIAGQIIPEVEEVEFTVETGQNEKGFWQRRTSAVEITIKRRARSAPMVNFFALVTNSNGKLKTSTGEIVLQDAAEKETFTIKLNNLWISNWGFNQAGGDADLLEDITVQAGSVTFAAGGKSVDFKVPQFHKPTS